MSASSAGAPWIGAWEGRAWNRGLGSTLPRAFINLTGLLTVRSESVEGLPSRSAGHAALPRTFGLVVRMGSGGSNCPTSPCTELH